MFDRIEIDRKTLQIVFDTAVHSMDFGSGFLDDEEVVGLRAVAEILGVDPMLATPLNFQCKYRGHHNPWGNELPYYYNMCKDCKRSVDGKSIGPAF